MKKKTRKTKKVLAAILMITVLGGIRGGITLAQFNSETATHVSNPSEIENATLMIGTHLIHMSAITDELYGVAQKSAEESGQYNWYYKSELANGTWYEISAASGVADISTAGTPVTDQDISELYVTHHTKSDGITYDLRTNQPVCIFDIDSPYELEQLEELTDLKNQYQILGSSTNLSKSDEYSYKQVRNFFASDVSDRVTDACDEELRALQTYYQVLAQNQAEAGMLEQLSKVMAAIDATRRYEVLSVVSNMLNTEEEGMQEISITRGSELATVFGVVYEEEEEVKTVSVDLYNQALLPKLNGTSSYNTITDFTQNSSLTDGAESSLEAVASSMTTYMGQMLVDGEGVFASTYYDAVQSLVAHAKSGEHSACDEDLDQLRWLDNIENNKMEDVPGELKYLEENLLAAGQNIYMRAVSGGVGSAYNAQATNGSISRAVLENLLKIQQSETNTVRNELQFLITAATTRMENAKAQEYVENCVNRIQVFYDNIPKEDDFYEYAYETVSEYEAFLKGLLSELAKVGGNSQMEELKQQRQESENAYLDALDKNDLDEAERQQVLLENIDAQIGEAEKELAAVLTSTTATEAEKASALAGLSADSSAKLIQELLDASAAYMEEEDYSGLGTLIEGIAALAGENPQLAKQSLEKVYTDLSLKLSQTQSILGKANIPQATAQQRSAASTAADEVLASDSVQAASEAAKEAAEQLKGTTGGEDILQKILDKLNALDKQEPAKETETLTNARQRIQAVLDLASSGELKKAEELDLKKAGDYADMVNKADEIDEAVKAAHEAVLLLNGTSDGNDFLKKIQSDLKTLKKNTEKTDDLEDELKSLDAEIAEVQAVIDLIQTGKLREATEEQLTEAQTSATEVQQATDIKTAADAAKKAAEILNGTTGGEVILQGILSKLDLMDSSVSDAAALAEAIQSIKAAMGTESAGTGNITEATSEQLQEAEKNANTVASAASQSDEQSLQDAVKAAENAANILNGTTGGEDILKQIQMDLLSLDTTEAEDAEKTLVSAAAEKVQKAIDAGTDSSTDAKLINQTMDQIQKVFSDQEMLFADAIDEETLIQLIEDYFGVEQEQFNDAQKAETAAALELYAQEMNGNAAIERFAVVLAREAVAEGNVYFFEKYNGSNVKFIPLDTISECSRFRYVFYNNYKRGILSKKGKVYTLEAFSQDMSDGTGEVRQLSEAARFQGKLYLSEKDTFDLFEGQAVYITEDMSGVYLTQDMMDTVQKLLDVFMKVGE